MPITTMELTEKSNPLDLENYISLTELNLVNHTTKNPLFLKDITKKSKRKELNISTSTLTNPQVSQELWLFLKKKLKENLQVVEDQLIDMMFMLELHIFI